MTTRTAVRNLVLPLVLTLAMATGCTYATNPVTGSYRATESSWPGADAASRGSLLTSIGADESPAPRRRSRRFSWGKAIALGFLIPSLVAVNVAAGMD